MADLEFLGPEDTGSMAAKLARMEAGAEPEPEVQPEPEPEPEPESEQETPPEETPPEEAKPPEEETPPEEEIPEGWEFRPKYKDHQEAEKGAREHQQKVTAATEQAKLEREAREAAERERDELRQRIAEQEAAKPPEPPAKTPEEVEVEQEAKIETALVEISELDEADPDYQKKVARAWRKAGVGGAGQPATPDPKALEEMIDRRVAERLQVREREAVQQREQETAAQAREMAIDRATKAGLDMTADSADEILFWTMAERLPEEMKGKPLQEQVDWAAGEVRKRIGKAVQMTDAEREKARKVQANNAVLERGNTRPAAPAAAPKLRSMDQILMDLETKGQQSRRA